MQVEPGAEPTSIARDDNHADGSISGRLVHCRRQLDRQPGIHRIETVGAIETDRTHSFIGGLNTQMHEVHDTRSRKK